MAVRKQFAGVTPYNDKGQHPDTQLAILDAIVAQWSATVLDAAEAALQEAAPSFELTAKATNSYADDTGATRAGTTAYVQTAADPSDAPDAAKAIAEGYRPGSTTDSIPPQAAAGSADLITYSPTDYSLWLNERGSGENMYLAEALHVNQDKVTDALRVAAEKHLRGEL